MFAGFQLTIFAIHILLLISQTKYPRISFSIVDPHESHLNIFH